MLQFADFLAQIEQPQNKSIFTAWESKKPDWTPESAVWFPGLKKHQDLNRKRMNRLRNLRNEWCKQTCGGRVVNLTVTTWVFERRGDAMLFFMRWKGMLD